MFSGDATLKLRNDCHDIVTNPVTLSLEGIDTPVVRPKNVEVQVSIADMAEPDQLKVRLACRDGRRDRSEELRYS